MLKAANPMHRAKHVTGTRHSAPAEDPLYEMRRVPLPCATHEQFCAVWNAGRQLSLPSPVLIPCGPVGA